ncbi:MAG: HIT domain-containing protein [Bacteroidota bacterium]
MFSPWRSAYIDTFKENKKGRICLFCKMKREKKEDEKHLVVWRGKHCFVVMNKYPYNSGHVLIVPYKHASDFLDLSPEEHKEIMKTASRCIKILRALSKPDGFNFGANLGRAAGAGVDKHIHFHVVPRWNGDMNFMPVLADVKIVSEFIEATRGALIKKFKDS